MEKNTQYAAALNFANCDGSYKYAWLQFSESYGFYSIVVETFFLSNWDMLWLILVFPNDDRTFNILVFPKDDRIFNVNYTFSRLKAMLTACKLKHAITYDVKIFYPMPQGQWNIYNHRCVIFTLKLQKV